MTEPTLPERLRIRWGWFFVCIGLGLTGTLIGLQIAPPADKVAYVAGVLGAVGTTLLLVGVVVLLLERRIVAAAAKVLRGAAEEARTGMNEELRAQVSDLEDRLARVWETGATDPQGMARKHDETRQMTDEFTQRIVDETTRASDDR
ncbi:DUF3093 domain-containing protein [Microbacterium sp. LWH7-1.2]|uniref:hypothetical protein n=1 Tax=Microbacterium sp. LWH7-1.2 TaxID=3135257 RepID=UPI0031388DA6